MIDFASLAASATGWITPVSLLATLGATPFFKVIRTCLRYHPDWIPWLDHSTSPPTFQVTPRATAQAATLALTECASVQVTERAERVPDAVRIVFIIDGEIYRSGTIQKYPLDGPDSGPGVLTTVVELGGGQCAIAKQQIETRPLPIPGVTSRANAKAWLKAQYPFIAAIDNTHFGFLDFATEVVPVDANPKPDPIAGEAKTPIAARTLRDMDDAPRQLVSGTMQEWMYKRSGLVNVFFTVVPGPLATQAEREKLAKIPPANLVPLTVTGTNAVTKIYKGRPQWMTATEQAPAGIAEAYYKTILAGCMHEGNATFVAAADGDLLGWHGKVLNIGGGASGWADMKATIHAVSWDLESGEVALSFGPNPDYAVQDFVAYLRLLRQRPATWMSAGERTSNELGGATEASAKGDMPHGNPPQPKPPAAPPDTLPPFWVSILPQEAATEEDPPTYSAVVEPGCVLERRRATEATNMIYWQPSNLLTTGRPTHFPAVIGEALYCDVFSSWPDGEVTAVSLNTDTDGLQTEEDPTYHVFHYKLGVFVDLGAGVVGFEPSLAGSHIYHWPEGKGLDLRVVKFEEGASGWQPVTGEDVTHYWRRGVYIGTTDPSSTADHLQRNFQTFPTLDHPCIPFEIKVFWSLCGGLEVSPA